MAADIAVRAMLTIEGTAIYKGDPVERYLGCQVNGSGKEVIDMCDFTFK